MLAIVQCHDEQSLRPTKNAMAVSSHRFVDSADSGLALERTCPPRGGIIYPNSRLVYRPLLWLV